MKILIRKEVLVMRSEILQILLVLFTFKRTGIGEVTAVLWTINDPPGLQGLTKVDIKDGVCF